MKKFHVSNFNKYWFWIFIIPIEIYSLIKLIIPFISKNNLMIWDMAGHYFSAVYLKEYLLPFVSGWNPFFFLGYPQNYFYSPLYSYLSAIFGTIIGVKLAFKLILALVILLTPVSFYYFGRKFNFSKLNSAVLMLLMYSVLFIVPLDKHLGGNMHTTFNIGLVGNALALMILFFYLGKLRESWKTKKFIGVSILLSLIILSHLFIAIIAAIAFIAFAIAYLRKREDIYFALKHIALTFGLTAFWVVPFLINLSYTHTIQMPFGFAIPIWAVLLFSTAYLIYTAVSKRKDALPIAILVFMLLSFMFVGYNFLNLQLHFYRFELFFYLIIPFVIVNFFKERDKALAILLIIMSIFILMNVRELHPEGSLDLPLINKVPQFEDGRMLILASPGNQASPHIYQHKVPLESRNHVVKGLFVESSPNSKYLFELEKSLDRYSTVWGILINGSTASDLNYSIIQKQLDLFNINYAFSFYKAEESWESLKQITFFNNKLHDEFKRYIYEVYRVSSSSIIEVLNYTPRVVEQNWEAEVNKWFLSEAVDNVLVSEKVPNYVGTGRETVELLEVSERQDYLRFRVDSPEPVPILIKISEFPNWRAYQDGARIKIYRASPYLMLVYGHGEIELNFSRQWYEIISIIISWGTVLMIFFVSYRKIKERKGCFGRIWRKFLRK